MKMKTDRLFCLIIMKIIKENNNNNSKKNQNHKLNQLSNN